MKTPKLYTPKTGVGRLAGDMLRRYYVHDVARDSAALTYYLLFALFPLLIFVSALLGILELDIDSITAVLTPLLPAGSVFRDPDAGLEALTDQRLLFAVALDEGGCNMAYYRMLSRLRRSTDLLSDSIGACIVTGVGEFYTKDVARDMVFAANQAGCGFLGRPLVEATGSLRNFRTQAQIGGTDEVTAFHAAVAELLSRLNGWEKPAPIRHVLALHASQRATSNTLALWELVKAGLPADMEVQEICLRNGTMADCNGCSYTACLHFGEQGGCFYGGPMVDEVYPAVRKCDALVMLCALSLIHI